MAQLSVSHAVSFWTTLLRNRILAIPAIRAPITRLNSLRDAEIPCVRRLAKSTKSYYRQTNDVDKPTFSVSFRIERRRAVICLGHTTVSCLNDITFYERLLHAKPFQHASSTFVSAMPYIIRNVSIILSAFGTLPDEQHMGRNKKEKKQSDSATRSQS